jgi:hypothetical protein
LQHLDAPKDTGDVGIASSFCDNARGHARIARVGVHINDKELTH